MPLTEKVQIQQEIGEIIDARSERRKLTIDTSPLERGEAISFDAFWFRQHKGFALYDSPLVGFPIEWDFEETPPPSIRVTMRRGKDGSLQIEIRDEGLKPVLARTLNRNQ